jgi:hypothetical protein
MGSSEFFFIDLFIIPQSRRTGQRLIEIAPTSMIDPECLHTDLFRLLPTFRLRHLIHFASTKLDRTA